MPVGPGIWEKVCSSFINKPFFPTHSDSRAHLDPSDRSANSVAFLRDSAIRLMNHRERFRLIPNTNRQGSSSKLSLHVHVTIRCIENNGGSHGKKGRSLKALKHAKLQTKELVPLAGGTLKPVVAVPHLLCSNKVHLYSKLFLPVTNVGCARDVKNQQECFETELASIQKCLEPSTKLNPPSPRGTQAVLLIVAALEPEPCLCSLH